MTLRSSYTSNALDPVMDQLRQVAGVVPSAEWWNECVAALPNPGTFEMVLEQILFHDVRDVVRTISSAENHNDASDMPPNALLLRNAMDESKQNDHRKRELPASFRLLLQIEEVCDVSQNAESRLTPSSNCRKFCCVDGHVPPLPLMAIEVSLIAAAAFPPGTKVLLTGPMTIRHGLMGWHAGNVLVLGGHVERLVQLQQQALQQRIQSSGHGMDPTIRALIWKQNDEHLRNEEDEDEHASGDVVETRPRNDDTSSSVPVHRIPANAVPNNPPARLSPQPVRAAISSQPPGAISSTNAAPSRQDVVPPSLSPRSASQPPPSRAAPSIPPSSTSSIRNRYAAPSQQRTASHEGTMLPSTTTAMPQVTHLNSTEMTAANTGVVSSNTENVMNFVQLRSFLNRVLQEETEYRQHWHRSFLVGPMQQVGPKLYFNISKRKKDGNANAATNDKQYEYVENAKFGPGSENDGGLVTCRIANSILEPCFSLSATEMKKLTRTDKPKSDILVRDGGKLVNQCLYQSGIYEATLEQSTERVFHSSEPKLLLDGDTPVLCLTKRK